MRAIATWLGICAALLLLVLLLRQVPSHWQAYSLMAGVALANIGMLAYVLRK